MYTDDEVILFYRKKSPLRHGQNIGVIREEPASITKSEQVTRPTITEPEHVNQNNEDELKGQLAQKNADEQEDFYLLKKDSQRRLTLTKVLTQDEDEVCKHWMKNIDLEVGQKAVLQMVHLRPLVMALRSYIAEPKQEIIVDAINKLKVELNFDSTAINQLHLAIYLFQNAVNEVLRMHSIKPHWMFALDNLVRSAVQATITILSPELGANLLGQERPQSATEGVEEGSTSGVSTVNSIKSQKTAEFIDNTKFWREYHEQMEALKVENMKLLQNLLEAQKCYQTLLNQALEDQRKKMTVLTELCENIDKKISRKTLGIPQISITDRDDETSTDVELVNWLQGLNIDCDVIEKFIYEKFTLEDILDYVTREDLRRLNLKGGIELKIWKAILAHRKEKP